LIKDFRRAQIIYDALISGRLPEQLP